jgi:ABC-2 type transport system permease protein
MFAHIFTNRLKCLLRSRVTVFWTLMFPILLAIFFNLSVRNIDSKEEIFHPVPVAVVNDSAYQKDASFRTALKSVSNGKNRIFTLTETSKANAAKLLADGKVDGYLTAGTKIGMTVNNSDFNQSIIESFLDSYMQTSSAVTSIMTANPSSYQKLAENMKTQADYLKNAPIGNASPNNALAYFYSLIAMACLYGSFWGMQEVTDIQADLSQRAARINLAPVHKLKAFLSSMTAAFVLSFLEILILLAFLRYGLNIDFGPKFGFVILTALVGCVVGLSLGAFVSALVKSSEGLKIGILLAITMAGCVLAGMMYQNIKYIIQKDAPIVGYLNPVNLLTDAFYCLYYYSTYSRYWLNVGLLGAFAAVFCAGTYFIIRRQKYASL